MNVAPVTLETARVRLVPLAREHVEALLAVANEPDVAPHSPQPDGTRAGMEAYVDDALAAQVRGDALPFTIIDRPSDRPIGATRYGAIAREHRRLEIGWTWLAKAFRRTHVNTECKLLLLTHAFETLGCERVEFKTDARNEVSRAALRRLGATEEGTLRRHMIRPDGTLRDSVYYAVIREEWPAVKARLAARGR